MPQDDLKPPFLEQVHAQESSAGPSSTGFPLLKWLVVSEARLHLEQDWAAVGTERSQTY